MAVKLAPQARAWLVRGLVLVAAGFAGWLLLGVYSVGPSRAEYLSPTRAFLRTALAGDTAALARQGAEPGAVRWAMQARRDQPAGLRALEAGLYLGGGTRNGDTTVVWFGARSAAGECVDWALRMYFVGGPDARRVGRVSMYCGTRATPPPGAS